MFSGPTKNQRPTLKILLDFVSSFMHSKKDELFFRLLHHSYSFAIFCPTFGLC